MVRDKLHIRVFYGFTYVRPLVDGSSKLPAPVHPKATRIVSHSLLIIGLSTVFTGLTKRLRDKLFMF